MRLALIALLAAGPAEAGIAVIDAHPIVTLLQSHNGLREAVPGAIEALGVPGGVEAALAQLNPAQQVALVMAAYRDEVPAGAVSESLGTRGPKAVAALAKLRLTEPQIQKIRARLSLETAEGSTRLYAAVRAFYETDPDLPALVKETLVVEGKTGRGTPPLAPSERFVAESEEPIPGTGLRVERGRYGPHRAARLHGADGTLTAVEIGMARDWGQARAKAVALGPGWDLPTESQVQKLVPSRAVDTPRFLSQHDEDGYYPVWGRYADEADNQALVDGIALFGFRRKDGEIDVLGLEPAEMDELSSQLAEHTGRPHDGVPVYAVRHDPEAKGDKPAEKPVEKKTLH